MHAPGGTREAARRWRAAGLVGALLCTAPGAAEHVSAAAPAIHVVDDHALEDVARAEWRGGRPTIVLNPARFAALPPAFRRFLLAHEQAHLTLRHSRLAPHPAGAGRPRPAHELRRLELDADCHAARTLAPSDRAAVDAAIRFFTQQGLFAHDAEHPAGLQRGSTIASCAGGAATDAAATRGAVR